MTFNILAYWEVSDGRFSDSTSLPRVVGIPISPPSFLYAYPASDDLMSAPCQLDQQPRGPRQFWGEPENVEHGISVLWLAACYKCATCKMILKIILIKTFEIQVQNLILVYTFDPRIILTLMNSAVSFSLIFSNYLRRIGINYLLNVWLNLPVTSSEFGHFRSFKSVT